MIMHETDIATVNKSKYHSTNLVQQAAAYLAYLVYSVRSFSTAER